MTRVQAIHVALCRLLGYEDSPTMQGEAWRMAEAAATAVRTADKQHIIRHRRTKRRP